MDNELWVILLPITLLPVFFAMGWFAARIDMKTVLKQTTNQKILRTLRSVVSLV